MCNIWMWICGLRRNKSTNPHHTPPETSCNGTLWLNVENLLLWDFRSCMHWDWNQLHYKQDECGICITIMHDMNAVVHKIHSCFMICVLEFMNHGCALSYMAVKQQFCCSSCWLCRCTHLLCKTDCQKLQTAWVQLAYWVSQVWCEIEADKKGHLCEPCKVQTLHNLY
jgi:hypothetical protein